MDIFGLDIGSHRIKAVQLSESGGKFKLLAFGSVPGTTKGLLSDAEGDLVALAEGVKKLYQETRMSTKNVVTALPQDQVFTRVITMPKLSEEELSASLKWEAEQYVPIPLEEVTLAHEVIGLVKEDTKEKIEVLLVAAPTRLIDKISKVINMAGLNLVSLEIEIISIARSLVTPESGVALVADLGAKATDLAIVDGGKVVFVRSVPTAGEALTRAIASSLGLEVSQAEAYKRAYGADPSVLSGKVQAAIAPVLQVIIGEMEKTVQFYNSERKDKPINRIILTGGTAGLPEVSAILAKRMNAEIQLGDPFANVAKDNLSSSIPQASTPSYAAAVGLAMKRI